MKHTSKTYNKKHTVTKNNLYKKALSIFNLSNRVVTYLRGDKSILSRYTSSLQSDHLSDELVMASLGLAPKIALAEIAADPTIKFESVSSIKKTMIVLLHHCEKIEECHENGKEFVKLLKKEIKQFSQLYHNWELQLFNKN